MTIPKHNNLISPDKRDKVVNEFAFFGKANSNSLNMHIEQNNYHLSEENLRQLKAWFTKYVHSFYTADPVLQPDLVLKEKHSHRVGDQILHIGSKLGLCDNDLRIAETMALLHDIGRFEQVTRYRTFSDKKSVNHAEMGLMVLQQEKALAALDEKTRQLILKAISYHNRLGIPAEESPTCLFYSRLLRDADKLDILALFANYYYVDAGERSTIVELELPDEPKVSSDVMNDLQQGKVVNMGQLKFLNDFKLLQMGWVYDVNFQPTLQALHAHGYLKKIRDTLPSSAAIDHIYAQMLSYIEGRL